MPFSADLVYASLQHALIQIVQKSSPNHHFSIQAPNQLVDPDEYANPGDVTAALEAFSRLVDKAPDLSPIYSSSGATISGLYGEFVGGFAENPGVAKKLVDAYQEMDGSKRTGLSDPSLIWYPAYPNPMDWADSVAATSLFTLFDEQIGAPETRPEAAKALIRDMSPTPGKFGARRLETARPVTAPPSAWIVAPSIEKLSQMAVRQAASFRDVAGSRSLSSIAAPAAAPAHVASPLLGSAGPLARPGAIRRPAGKASASAAAPAPAPIAGQRFHVRFRYLLVTIERRWMKPELLSLAGVSVPGRAKASFSNGDGENNPGLLPLIPSGLLVARDITLEANWDDADLQRIHEATSGTRSVAFGPLVMSGGGDQRATKIGNAITAPGLQILGRISHLTPLCPSAG